MSKEFKVIISLVFVIFSLVLIYYFVWPKIKKGAGPQACIQVITTAKSPWTGRVKTFGTPCEVPWGWKMISPKSF